MRELDPCENFEHLQHANHYACQKNAASKREMIEPTPSDKRYVRLEADNAFGHTVDVGKSLSADKRSQASRRCLKGKGAGETRHKAMVAEGDGTLPT